MRLRSSRRRVALAAAAMVAAVAAVALTFVAMQPVDTAATPTDDGRVGGAAGAVSTAVDAVRVPTVRNPVEAPAAAAPAEAQAPSADPAEAEVLALVNAERTANGCSPLVWDESLAAVARLHSADMATRDYFDHITPEGLTPDDRAAAGGTTVAAENIAAGYSTATEALAGWMASEGHRDNILNCSFTRTGIGVGYGGSYGTTWTQLFGW